METMEENELKQKISDMNSVYDEQQQKVNQQELEARIRDDFLQQYGNLYCQRTRFWDYY